MNTKEEALLRLLKQTPRKKLTTGSKNVMVSAAKARFDAQCLAREASRKRVEPMYEAIRSTLSRTPEFSGIVEASKKMKWKPSRSRIATPIRTNWPKKARLRIGSVHLVDVPPFQTLNWQAATGGGPPYPDAPPTANSNGNMSLLIQTGGDANSYNVSCWAAVGQSYSIPDAEGFQNGGIVNFSASPSFVWEAIWYSIAFRQAAGNIWLGQVINEFNDQGTLVSTPVSYQTSLFSWNDYNFGDSPTPENGESTGFNLQCSTFVQPGFFYECWVWIGASANADGLDSGNSLSNCQMSANVGALIFDSFACPPPS